MKVIEMTNHGIEALAAQRIAERQAEAGRERLSKQATTHAGTTRRRLHLPSLPWRQSRPATGPA
jgi:hypothetical protein